MGKMFTNLVTVFGSHWEMLAEEINKKLDKLGNPKIIDVKVFSTDFFEGLCALLILEEKS